MYLQPQSLAEALQLRAQHPHAVVLAGATRVLARPAALRPAQLLDLQQAGLDRVEYFGEQLHIGAMTPLHILATFLTEQHGFSALRQAILAISPRQIRQQATLGGNIASAGSLLAPLALLDARLQVASLRGTREVALLPCELAPDEILTGVVVKGAAFPTNYQQFRRTPLGPALVAVAVARRDGQFDLAIQGVQEKVVQLTVAGDGDLTQQLLQSLKAISDSRASGKFRLAVLVELALRAAFAMQAADI